MSLILDLAVSDYIEIYVRVLDEADANNSIAIGNQFYFHEHAYQELKNKLKSNLIRPQFYNN